MKTIVLGASGLVGSAVMRLSHSRRLGFLGFTSKDLDLLHRQEVFDFFLSLKPQTVILAAAKVGGIGANSNFPVDFLSQNIQIQTNVMDASHASGVDRLVFLGSSCIYPKAANQPILENALLTGPLEETNSAYAVAKISGIELVRAYRKQFKKSWISLMPTNLYGPNDNFDRESSHVLPALIGKFVDACDRSDPAVTLWGSGNPLREFMHVDDFARAILHVLPMYDEDDPLNVGTGEEISIKSLANIVAEISGFSGEIKWDGSRPDGVVRKILDTRRLTGLGFEPEIGLFEGITETIAWYRSQIRGAHV